MKRITLGKIVLVWLMVAATLFGGSVSATLNKSEIYRGDVVNLTITAEGEDVSFPNIQKIGDATILGTSTAQSTTIINGKMSQKKSKTYTFAPQKGVKIPSFNVTVDGEVLKTNPLEVKVVKPTAAKAGAPFVLEMKLEKPVAHVGESVRLDLKFKQKRGVKADKIEITPPNLQNFWVKEIKGAKQSLEGDYVVQTYSYLLFPQKAGEYTIPSVVANIGTRVKRRGSFGGFNDPFFNDPFFDSFVSSIEWKKLFSNEAKLKVEPLPGGLEVYGHFRIDAKVDKKEVAANKPVNLTITIEGEGNVDDIKKFDIEIPDAVVYADEPKVESGLQNGKYVGKFTQKIAIIAEKDFTIPAISFSYFDKERQEKVTIKTEPIAIKVKGGVTSAQKSVPKMETSKELRQEIAQVNAPQKTLSEQKEGMVSKEDQMLKYLYLLLGVVWGAGGMYLFANRKSVISQKESKPILKEIRRAKDDKALYRLLLPYAKEGSFIEEMLKKLEENLYKGANHKIDRNEIVDYFEEVLGVK